MKRAKTAKKSCEKSYDRRRKNGGLWKNAISNSQNSSEDTYINSTNLLNDKNT